MMKNGASMATTTAGTRTGTGRGTGLLGMGRGSASIALTGCGDRRSLPTAILRLRRDLLSHKKLEKILDNNFGIRIFSPIISHPSILFSHRPSSLSHGRGPLHACLSQSGFLYASRLMLRHSSTLGCSSHRLQPDGRPWTPQSLVGSIEHSTNFSQMSTSTSWRGYRRRAEHLTDRASCCGTRPYGLCSAVASRVLLGKPGWVRWCCGFRGVGCWCAWRVNCVRGTEDKRAKTRERGSGGRANYPAMERVWV
jgi:hypothetical protein